MGPAPYAAQFAAEMRSYTDNFGLMVDLLHLPQTYETSKFALRTMHPYITHLHIGSAVMTPGAAAYGDTHPRFGFPNAATTWTRWRLLAVCMDEGLFDESDPSCFPSRSSPGRTRTPTSLWRTQSACSTARGLFYKSPI
jgi:hypothetical protein